MTMGLLSWPGENGRTVYLSTDNGSSFVSRMANDVESAHLETAGELLRKADTAARTRQPGDCESELAGMVRPLCTALRNVLRIAESRGARLAARGDGAGPTDMGQRTATAPDALPVNTGGASGPVVRRWHAEPEYVGHARQLLWSYLEAWDMAELADTAALVLSELHGNAVRHANLPDEGLIETRFERLANGRLRIEVHDTDDTKPERLHPAADAESGRGLAMVDTLTSGHWGVSGRNGPGKTVWAECTTTTPS